MSIPTGVHGEGAGRLLALLSLVLAGEAIFGLPFHVSRFFRPTFVDVFGITQTQLGGMGSLYGATAMVSYLLGGGLADKFSPRRLLSGSLVVTGCSGFYMLSIPAPVAMYGLFSFWGVSTILPFWSALIRATRDWGGPAQQGRAFGLLDGGRGLLAALMAMLALFLFAMFLPSTDADATIAEKTQAIQATILVYTLACFGAAAMVWFFLSDAASHPGRSQRTGTRDRPASRHLSTVLRMPAVWFQALVIIGAYCTFKGIDYYSQYARDLWGWSDVDAAGLSAFSSWMRPIAAIAAGFCADRWKPSSTVVAAFGLTALASASVATMTPGGSPAALLWAIILIGCLGIFALRGIYFALLQESGVPVAVTGTAVGVVSFIGYTPEIFMPLIGGLLIDQWDGTVRGYRVLFSILVAASVIGIVASLALRRHHGRSAVGATQTPQ